MPFSAHLFGGNEADQVWVDKMCTPHPFAGLAEKISLTGTYASVRNRTYVVASGWHPSPSSRSTSGSGRLRDLACGHDVMIDMPQETAKILLEAAQP